MSIKNLEGVNAQLLIQDSSLHTTKQNPCLKGFIDIHC